MNIVSSLCIRYKVWYEYVACILSAICYIEPCLYSDIAWLKVHPLSQCDSSWFGINLWSGISKVGMKNTCFRILVLMDSRNHEICWWIRIAIWKFATLALHACLQMKYSLVFERTRDILPIWCYKYVFITWFPPGPTMTDYIATRWYRAPGNTLNSRKQS